MKKLIILSMLSITVFTSCNTSNNNFAEFEFITETSTFVETATAEKTNADVIITTETTAHAKEIFTEETKKPRTYTYDWQQVYDDFFVNNFGNNYATEANGYFWDNI
ncbi:MAG: hypothetical protein FWG90_05055 [Oscillospiraceae bacterium]|nr:hypothetical protein [Oscillospiraceae bacterium]